MKCSSIGNLRDKKGKFTSQKQLANGESISCSCFLYSIMIDTHANSDLVKAKLVTFVLKIINSKSVSKTTFTGGNLSGLNLETDKNLSVFAYCVRRSSHQKNGSG